MLASLKHIEGILIIAKRRGCAADACGLFIFEGVREQRVGDLDRGKGPFFQADFFRLMRGGWMMK